MQLNEKTFHGKRNINYVFFEGEKSFPLLLVAFQAVPSGKDQNGKIVKSYNYIKSVSDINVNKLFIEDCGELGCYYLCNDMNFDIEASVVSLIERTRKKYGVPKENVITFGSSKGGSAAMYFGSKYGYGHVICGAPQTKIATYLSRTRPSMIEYMVGKEMKPEDLDYIDSLVLGALKPENTTMLNILTSYNDSQYTAHIKPLIEKITTENIKADIVFNDQISCHTDIAIFFPKFLVDNIIKIISDIIGIQMPDFKADSSGVRLIEKNKKKSGLKTFAKIVSDRDDIIEEMELTDKYFEFKTDEVFSGKLVYTVVSGGEKIFSTVLLNCIFDQGYFGYNDYSVSFDSENKLLRFKLNISLDDIPVSYSYALNHGKKQMIPTFRCNEPFYDFPVTEAGSYTVKFLISIKGKGMIRGKTAPIQVLIK